MIKFKKITSIFLLLILITVKIGIIKHSHFCGEELASESFFLTDNNCGCDPNEESDCCKNETETIQFREQTIVNLPNEEIKPLSIILIFFTNFGLECSQVKLSLKKSTQLFLEVRSVHEPPDILLKKMSLLI